MTPVNSLYTIGHSNQPIEHFVQLLRNTGIEVLVDVRSSPFSKFVSHFNKENIEKTLKENRIKYLYMGNQLGGRPSSDEFYDHEGYVRYDLMANSKNFQDGIARLLKGITKFKVAIMCGEENPLECHRRLLVGRVMHEKGAKIFHIRGNETIQTEEELSAIEKEMNRLQVDFFVKEQEVKWKSIRSVLQRKVPSNFSGSSNDLEFND